jgi:hypothetical protein
VASTETIYACAVATGSTTSAVATATYTINSTLPAPTFSVATGTYTTAQTVAISEATAGSTIYYTTNGTTPTTSSTKYTGAISVASTETISAIAAATGHTNSPVAAATYTIEKTMPSPTFSVATGTYTAAQTVAISEATAGSTIYYTTNGTAPTTSSTKYTGAISVTSTETISAIAAATGYNNSAVAIASYTITTGGSAPGSTLTFNFGSGFTGSQALVTSNGNAQLDGAKLQLTNGQEFENGAAWYSKPVNVQSFTTNFSFQLTSAVGDGFTFAIQSVGPHAMGSGGAGLGYANIPLSVGLKFDLHNNAGEGPESVGVYTKGAVPMGAAGSVSLVPSGIDIHSGHVMTVKLVYDGTNLTMTLTDTVTKVAFTKAFAVNIPSIVGSKTAYVGFTGASGGIGADQEILTWTYAN